MGLATMHWSVGLNNGSLPLHALMIVPAGKGLHQDGGLVPGQVVIIKLWPICIQMALWKIDGAQPGRVQALNEEVIKQRIIIALVVHVVGMGDLLPRPAFSNDHRLGKVWPEEGT